MTTNEEKLGEIIDSYHEKTKKQDRVIEKMYNFYNERKQMEEEYKKGKIPKNIYVGSIITLWKKRNQEIEEILGTKNEKQWKRIIQGEKKWK